VKRALQFYATTFAWTLAVVIFVAAGFVLYRVQQVIDHDAQESTQSIAKGKAQAIGQLILFYQGVGQRFLEDTQVTDVVVFGDAARAERWSTSIRRRLPDIVGVALFTGEGRILGEAVNQRVGPECLADMQTLAQGDASRGPHVHQEVQALAHFDVSTRVRRDDETVGIIFISVALQRLRMVMEENTGQSERLTLTDGRGTTFMVAGDAGPKEQVESIRVHVPNSDWVLDYSAPKPPMRAVYLSFGILTILTMGIAAGAVILLTSIASRRLRRDLNGIQGALESLADGQPSSMGDVHLFEVEQMRPVFDRIANAIHARQQFLAELSSSDSLTGLPNRRHLESQWPHYRGLAQRGQSVSVGLIDVDYFKAINDQYGHEVGDKVLKHLAAVIRQTIRSADMAARIGGDEFVVMLVDMGPESLQHWYQRLSDGLQSAPDLSIPPNQLSLSVGFAMVSMVGDSDLQAVLRQADSALYHSKERGRGRLSINDRPTAA